MREREKRRVIRQGLDGGGRDDGHELEQWPVRTRQKER